MPLDLCTFCRNSCRFLFVCRPPLALYAELGSLSILCQLNNEDFCEGGIEMDFGSLCTRNKRGECALDECGVRIALCEQYEQQQKRTIEHVKVEMTTVKQFLFSP